MDQSYSKTQIQFDLLGIFLLFAFSCFPLLTGMSLFSGEREMFKAWIPCVLMSAYILIRFLINVITHKPLLTGIKVISGWMHAKIPENSSVPMIVVTLVVLTTIVMTRPR